LLETYNRFKSGRYRTPRLVDPLDGIAHHALTQIEHNDHFAFHRCSKQPFSLGVDREMVEMSFDRSRKREPVDQSKGLGRWYVLFTV
jgi:hypothetical protein